MQPSYKLTVSGMMFAIASPEQAKDLSLLKYILKEYADRPVSLDQIRDFFQGDQQQTYQHIYALLNQQFIDINEDESESVVTSVYPSSNLSGELSVDSELVITDDRGLLISYAGFDKSRAEQLSAIASDYMAVAERSRFMEQSASQGSPFVVKIAWQDRELNVYLIYLGGFRCLLSCYSNEVFQNPHLIRFISTLFNRYDYD